jgi:hypothetical protein
LVVFKTPNTNAQAQMQIKRRATMTYALIAVLIAQAVYTYVVAGGSHENID